MAEVLRDGSDRRFHEQRLSFAVPAPVNLSVAVSSRYHAFVFMPRALHVSR